LTDKQEEEKFQTAIDNVTTNDLARQKESSLIYVDKKKITKVSDKLVQTFIEH